MKKEVAYHEVIVSFAVSEREAKRVTNEEKKSVIRSRLARMVAESISHNHTNSMDAEDVKVIIDGKPEIGA